MYRCICHTCGEDESSDELEQAQDYFTTHAVNGCEVELHNVASTGNPLTAEPSQSETTTPESQPAEE